MGNRYNQTDPGRHIEHPHDYQWSEGALHCIHCDRTPDTPMRDRILQVVLGVFLLAIIFGLIATFAACSSPTEPLERCAECHRTVLAPPSGQINAAQARGRDLVRSAVESGEIVPRARADWDWLPPVRFEACPFLVQNGRWSSDGQNIVTGPTCAAGMATINMIVISTHDQANVLHLLAWETANQKLLEIGRPDLTDVWLFRRL